MCQEFCAHCFREKGFCEKHEARGRLWPRGGGGGEEEKEHQAPLLFSALGCVTSPAVSHRSAEGDTTPGSADEV